MQPVWEITGAEFTNQGVHTADGISIRFPRITRIRHDKDWSTATSLNNLRRLFKRSSESIDLGLLLPPSSECSREGDDEQDSPNKSKSPSKRNDGTKSIKKNSSPRKLFGKSKDSAKSDFTERNNEEISFTGGEHAGKAEFYAFVNGDVCNQTSLILLYVC